MGLPVLAALAAAATLTACGGSSEDGDGSNTGNSSGAGNGVADDDTEGFLGSTDGTGGPGGPSGGNGTAVGTNGVNFSECAGDTRQAEGVQLDMYVMFDHTGSMGNDCPLNLEQAPPGNSSKWCFATHALAQYFTSLSASGHRAALQFLAQPDYSCNADPDNSEATPAVGLTVLPVTNGDALVQALDEDDPVGGLGTPIAAGLHGIATFTAGARSEGRAMIGVLITDGDPNECTTDTDDLAQIAGDHFEATGIRTFVIGMTGATLTNLEPIAEAGGAPEHTDYCDGPGSCHYWSVGDGDPETFVSALQAIQAAAVLPCEYQIPAAPAGQTFQSALVNVTFTENDVERVFPGVASEGACTTDGGGWYYDNAADPSSIRLCPSSCEAVTAAGLGADVHIAYGCDTVTELR